MSNDPSANSVLKKQIKLVDQMISQHAYLRDHYGRWSTALDITLLTMSAVLAAITFADVKTLLQSSVILEQYVGILSILIFLASVISWKVDWKGREISHRDSVNILSAYKRDIIDSLNSKVDISTVELERFSQEYALVSEKCVKIPEKYFLKTKQYHKRKVELSKELDSSSFAFLWIIKIKLWWRHTLK